MMLNIGSFNTIVNLYLLIIKAGGRRHNNGL